MKTRLSLLATLLIVLSAQAQMTNQTFQLRNGWNSIWLEIEPTNTSIAAVFANLPLASVWTYVPKDSSVEFIQQQTEDLFNEPAWLPHFPPPRPEAFLSKLYEVHALQPYLVKLTNVATTITLTVTGVPVVRPVKWITDSFNLRGFPVNPNIPPTFASFFGNAPAHAGQAIYELQPGGQWQLVNLSTTMKRGEGYWSFCRGDSTYQGPSGITLDFGEGLIFGTVLNELTPRIINSSTNARTVCLRDLFTGANNPLSYQIFVNNRLNWVNLPSPYCFTIGPGTTIDLRLAMRRKDFSGTNFASIIEVTDDIGTRYLVPVTAAKLLPARSSLNSLAGVGNPAAGLWVGSASITNVNEANSRQPMNVTPTRASFDLRLLVHVDAGGQARLLKEVIQMWQNGTTTNDALGRAVVDRAGRFVLLTDDSKIPQYQGGSLRDGVPVGKRFSTIDFDFEGGTNNALTMTGLFQIGNTNRCTIVLEPDFATNPFKHRFHPDHDNLDATYQHSKDEAYQVTRNLELRYSATDPAGTNSALSLDYGYNVIGGVYRETLAGLHRTNIVAQGSFRLTRVANSPVLNQ
jgi:hypothetical protein